MASLLLNGVRAAILLLALAAIAATALPSLDTDVWWIRYLEFPRLEFTLAMLAILVLLLALPRRGAVSLLAAILLFGACVWNASILFPYLGKLAGVGPAPAVAAGSCPPAQLFRVLEANVQMTNRHDHRLLDMVRQTKPDLAWFQETNAWWEQELGPLSQLMPYGVAQTKANYFGVHLFSKWPLSDDPVHDLTHSDNPSVFATVTFPSGQTARIYAIHPHPPQVGQSTAERDAQLMATALAAHADTMPHLVLGDMNAVPWAGVIRRTARIGGFDDPRIGRGLFITWNANSTVLKWPLDQILPGPNWTLADLRVLPEFSSDHHPLLADLCLGAGSAPRQPASPDDLAQARATVAKGQGRADHPGAATPPGSEAGPRD